MDVTTQFRSHWIAADGTRYEKRRDEEFKLRLNLQPIVNVDEMRAYADLGDQLLPDQGMTPQFYARRLCEQPKVLSPRQITLLVEELTDDIPVYHSKYRTQFLELRNRWPGFDSKKVVAYGK